MRRRSVTPLSGSRHLWIRAATFSQVQLLERKLRTSMCGFKGIKGIIYKSGKVRLRLLTLLSLDPDTC